MEIISICVYLRLLHVIYHLCTSEKSAVYFIILTRTIQHDSAMYFCEFQRFLRAFYCMSSIICVHLRNLRFISSSQSEQSSTPVRCISANFCAFCEPLFLIYIFSAILSFALRLRGFLASSSSSGTITLLFTKRNGQSTLPKKSLFSCPSVFPVFITFFTMRSSSE